MERWYERKHRVAKSDVTAVAPTSSSRYTPVEPQWPPVRIALREASTPQLTGLKRDAIRIQCGIDFVGMRIAEMNISGRPTKFAVAIIDASLRTSNATPCEKPANAAARRNVAANTTSQPRKPP